MGYQDEWMLLEAGDIIDEMEHRPPTEEMLSSVPSIARVPFASSTSLSTIPATLRSYTMNMLSRHPASPASATIFPAACASGHCITLISVICFSFFTQSCFAPAPFRVGRLRSGSVDFFLYRRFRSVLFCR